MIARATAMTVLFADWRATAGVVARLEAETEAGDAAFLAACRTAGRVRARIIRAPALTPADLLLKAHVAAATLGLDAGLSAEIEGALAAGDATGETLCLAVVRDLRRLAAAGLAAPALATP